MKPRPALSGVRVQVLTGEAARRWAGFTRAGLGAVYLPGYLARLLKKRVGGSAPP